MKNLHPDYAIKNSSQDILERTKYAENVSDIMLAQTEQSLNNGLVIGLYGAWGDGKTSFINLIKECLKIKSPNIVKNSENFVKIKTIVNTIFNYLCIVFLCSFNFIYFLSKYNIFENIVDSIVLFYASIPTILIILTILALVLRCYYHNLFEQIHLLFYYIDL